MDGHIIVRERKGTASVTCQWARTLLTSFFLFLPAAVDTMLRRKPTRLELKIDDTEEFENVKKELEVSITHQQPKSL